MYKNTGDKLTILEPVVVNSVTQLGFHTVTYLSITEWKTAHFMFYLIKMQRAIWPLTCFKNIQSISYS